MDKNDQKYKYVCELNECWWISEKLIIMTIRINKTSETMFVFVVVVELVAMFFLCRNDETNEMLLL